MSWEKEPELLCLEACSKGTSELRREKVMKKLWKLSNFHQAKWNLQMKSLSRERGCCSAWNCWTVDREGKKRNNEKKNDPHLKQYMQSHLCQGPLSGHVENMSNHHYAKPNSPSLKDNPVHYSSTMSYFHNAYPPDYSSCLVCADSVACR